MLQIKYYAMHKLETPQPSTSRFYFFRKFVKFSSKRKLNQVSKSLIIWQQQIL